MASQAELVVVAAAVQAGFVGNHLVQAVAVSFAEDGSHDPAAVNVNHDSYGSRDRGLWQINDHWHPEYTDAQCFDPVQCASAAYTISQGGKSWHEWATYTNGSAALQVPKAAAAINAALKAAGSNVQLTNASFTATGATGNDPNNPVTVQTVADVGTTQTASWYNPLDWAKTLKGWASHIPIIGPAVGAVGSAVGGVGSGVGSLLSFPEAIVKAFGAVLKIFQDLLSGQWWLRVGQGLAAGLLLLIGLILIFRTPLEESGITGAVKGAAKDVSIGAVAA